MPKVAEIEPKDDEIVIRHYKISYGLFKRVVKDAEAEKRKAGNHIQIILERYLDGKEAN